MLSDDDRASVDAVRARAAARNGIVFVSGKFNILHPGHIRLLEFARSWGDFLVVGVVSTGLPGITIAGPERLASVKALSMVDEACLVTGSIEAFVAALKPDVVVKGREYALRQNVEQEIVGQYGGKVIFSSGEQRFSSQVLLQNEYLNSTPHLIKVPDDFLLRHSLSATSIVRRICDFPKLRVTVVGDLIVDDYIDCEPLGMSQEDPTIVVAPLRRHRFVGGAGIVAAHARGLGAQVNFVTVAGKDAVADYAENDLLKQNIRVHMVRDESRPTTLKTRFRASGKTLLRVSDLRQHTVEREIADAMFARLTRCIDESDLLVFSDFNYGCLPQDLVEALRDYAASRHVMMAADSQASSQISDVSRFRGMRLITPTEREARLAMSDFAIGLAVLAENLRSKADSESVVITLGGDGMLILGEEAGEWMTDRLLALNDSPKDTAGAGDSFLITASMALALGMTVWEASYAGAIAAAIQVSRVGNTPLTLDEIVGEFERQKN